MHFMGFPMHPPTFKKDMGVGRSVRAPDEPPWWGPWGPSDLGSFIGVCGGSKIQGIPRIPGESSPRWWSLWVLWVDHLTAKDFKSRKEKAVR